VANPDWCLLHIDGKKCICPRVRSVIKLGKAGWLHKVADNGLNMQKKAVKKRSNRCVNWKNIATHYYNTSRRKFALIEELANGLGLKDPGKMRNAWRIGWDGEAFTLPSMNGYEELTGIMRRFPDGHKVWVSRSRNGLFIPKLKTWQGNLFVCEGWSDAAALIEMGFRAIARSNCETGTEDIKTLLRRRNEVERVTVVADNDPDNVHGDVGQRGAKRLARALHGQVQTGLLIIPEEYKDMRQWYTEADPVKQAVVERCTLC
jgi:hypothetical protein